MNSYFGLFIIFIVTAISGQNLRAMENNRGPYALKPMSDEIRSNTSFIENSNMQPAALKYETWVFKKANIAPITIEEELDRLADSRRFFYQNVLENQESLIHIESFFRLMRLRIAIKGGDVQVEDIIYIINCINKKNIFYPIDFPALRREFYANFPVEKLGKIVNRNGQNVMHLASIDNDVDCIYFLLSINSGIYRNLLVKSDSYGQIPSASDFFIAGNDRMADILRTIN